jgi:gluconate 2-dehydrogenase gamma chain
VASPRREFLRQLALLTAGLASTGVAAGALAGCRRRRASPAAPPTFTGARAATLAAACARILPTDHEPGATEAGCASYIDRQLGLPHFDALRGQLERGLDHLDEMAKRAHGRPFAACGPAEEDALLVALQGERRRGVTGGQVFGLLLTLTLEGFLGDPRHGGNRGEVGWRFAGYTPCWFHGGGRGRRQR